MDTLLEEEGTGFFEEDSRGQKTRPTEASLQHVC